MHALRSQSPASVKLPEKELFLDLLMSSLGDLAEKRMCQPMMVDGTTSV